MWWQATSPSRQGRGSAHHRSPCRDRVGQTHWRCDCGASPGEFAAAIAKPEIQAAFRLTLLSCTAASILSLWVATPLGYLLSRFRFPGRWIIDTIVDIPIVLPPLVLGLSLLILFHTTVGGFQLERWLTDSLGFPVTFHWPAVVLAQFSVSCAFAVRTNGT